MAKYKTQSTYKPSDDGKEFNTGKSMTVPNDAMSMKQILERARNGMPPEFRHISYIDQEDLSKIDELFSPHIDLTDLDTMKKRIQETEKIIEDAIKKRDKEEDPEPGPDPEPDPTPDPEPET